jgi:uncharacterized protein YigE (DUF2233 family)
VRFKIEADPETELVRIWWTQEFKGKPYGQFMRVRLPIDHLEPYLEELKRSHADAMAALLLEDDE